MKMHMEKANHPPFLVPWCHIWIDQPIFFHSVLSQVPWRQTEIGHVHWRVPGAYPCWGAQEAELARGSSGAVLPWEGTGLRIPPVFGCPQGDSRHYAGQRSFLWPRATSGQTPSCELWAARTPSTWRVSASVGPYLTAPATHTLPHAHWNPLRRIYTDIRCFCS